MPQLIGSVRWFNNAKGYGFISHEGGADVFCHFTSIQHDGYKSLKEGDAVLFEIVQGRKGPQTDKVIRQKGATAVEPRPSMPLASTPEQK